MTSIGPVVKEPHRLLTHKDYTVEEIKSILKLTDLEPCEQLGTEDLGVSPLFDLTRDRCVAKEGVITRVRKHNKNLMDQQEQYKEAIRTLNGELKEVGERLEEASRREQALQGELTALNQQVASAHPDLDLSGITMDDAVLATPARGAVAGECDDSMESDLPTRTDDVILAQPATTPPVDTSNPSLEILEAEDPFAQGKDDEALVDAPTA
ncbi:hypothetical protein SO802_006759 [Lithocarpus litseifolius]|uniref:Uncharacterized protein n=1 Tax=Lithocarpus litseifolius TaxID=425828 RepID=A0AAW2DMM3_9ROSI